MPNSKPPPPTPKPNNNAADPSPPKGKQCCCKKCCAKLCKCCCSCFKPSLCKCCCWYCCSCWLIPIMIATLGFLGIEIYMICTGAYAFPDLNLRLMIFLSLASSGLLLPLIQITFFFIRNEFSSKKSIIIWSILFVVTLALCLTALVLSFICKKYCPFNDKIVDLTALKNSKMVHYSQLTRWISLAKFLLIILVLHIYIFYTYRFYQEKNDPCHCQVEGAEGGGGNRENKGRATRTKTNESESNNNSAKVSPEEQLSSNANPTTEAKPGTKVHFKLFYAKL